MAASDVAAEAAIDAALDRIDEAEEVAHALAQLARADDQDLESFAGLWLDARPIAVGDLRRCRDFMRAMVAAILDQKSDDWARLRLAHASAFPPLEPSPAPVHVAAAAAPQPSSNADSPWIARSRRERRPRTVVGTFTPSSEEVLPFGGGGSAPVPSPLAPHPEAGGTLDIDSAPSVSDETEMPLGLRDFAQLAVRVEAQPERAAELMAEHGLHGSWAELLRRYEAHIESSVDRARAYVIARGEAERREQGAS